MNKEIYERLSPYEHQLHTAYYAQFVRNMTRKGYEDLSQIYEELFKSKSQILTGCNHCIYQDILKIASAYYNYKPEEISSDNEQAEKPKRGRKPKADN